MQNPKHLFVALGLLAAPAAAQSWDQHLVTGTTETRLPSGLAVTPSVVAFGQPRFNPYQQAGIEDVVRVFELQGGAFVEVAALTSAEPSPSSASYGRAIAIEGNLLAVGDPQVVGPGFTSGAVHVYRRFGSGWMLEQVVRPLAVATSALEFGTAIDMQGGRLVVGAPTSTVSSVSFEEGAVYVYEQTHGAFVEVQRIDNPAPALFAGFGRDVDLDGDRLLVGAPGGAPDGAAYLFEHTAGAFGQVASFQAAAPYPGGQFGSSVALEGSVAAFGSPGVSIANFADGRVHVFEDLAGWVETQVLEFVTTRPYGRFGGDLELEGGSLFVTSENTISARRYDPSPGGWIHAESYSTAAGIAWTPVMPVRVRSIGTAVVLTDPLGATVFPREVVAELEIGCGGTPLPNGNPSVPSLPVVLDAQGQISLSEATLPFLLAHAAPIGPGVLLYGFNSASVPFGGASLCIGSPLVRAQVGSPISGSFTRVDLDLATKPVAGGPKSIAPGMQVHFQYWFRVPGGGTHLSSSLRAVFAP